MCEDLNNGKFYTGTQWSSTAGGDGNLDTNTQPSWENLVTPRPVAWRYGLMCASLSSSNPCTNEHVIGSQQWDGGKKWLYLVTTTSKFTAASATNDDGVLTYPTSGTVTQTNSGKKSMMIGGNVKFGETTSYNTNMMLVKIDRFVGQGISNSHMADSVNTYQAPSSWYSI